MKKLSFLLISFFVGHIQPYAASFPEKIIDKRLVRFDHSYIQELLEVAKNRGLEKFGSKVHKYLISDDDTLSVEHFVRVSSIDEIDSQEIQDSLFLVFFHTDDDYFYNLKKINDFKGVYYSLPSYEKTRFAWVDKNAAYAIDKTFSFGNRISHPTLEVHENICHCLSITKSLPGDYVEIGVFKGGSALTALNYMKFANCPRKSYFLDTFNGMTYEQAYISSDIHWEGTHVLWGVEQTMRHVESLLETSGQDFTLVESNICRDPIPSSIQKIAVCNMDVDLYDATLMGLIKVAPLIVKGGIIICEDPTSTPALGGALLAMEEFLRGPLGGKFIKVLSGAQYLLIKIED